MSMKTKNSNLKTAAAVVIGAGLALGTMTATASSFSTDKLSSGYNLAENHVEPMQKSVDGKCGAGKCGENKMAKGADGKCGAGKCGAGKCGENKMAKDGAVKPASDGDMHKAVSDSVDSAKEAVDMSLPRPSDTGS